MRCVIADDLQIEHGSLLDRRGVDFIVILVIADPADEDHTSLVIHPRHDPPLVPANVEHHSAGVLR